MVANTGAYVDSPFLRFADGIDLAELSLASLADLEGIVVRALGSELAITAEVFRGLEIRGTRPCWYTPTGRGTGAPTVLLSHIVV
jgi:hypothetical protein